MACENPVGDPIVVRVNASSSAWLDTGLTLLAGEYLRVTALGTTVKFGVNADQCAYPEGYYGAASSPCAISSYDPSTVTVTHGGDPPDAYIAADQPPYCLLAKIASASPSGTHVSGTLRPNREALFSATTVGAGGRVWLAMNDNIFVDNSGFWTVTLQRLVSAPAAPPVITAGGDTGQGSRPGIQSDQIYQSLSVSFPGGYLTGVDLASQPTLFHTAFTSVRVRGPYRGYLVGSILHVCDEAGELLEGTALDGVDILRIGD